jgi:uncharacterized protein YjeT (DUF2065 family)
MWQDLLTAIALLLIVEGILPFMNPDGFRRTMKMISQLDDSVLRFCGLTAMTIGCLLLYALR